MPERVPDATVPKLEKPGLAKKAGMVPIAPLN
jgi:hypothetical protein